MHTPSRSLDLSVRLDPSSDPSSNSVNFSGPICYIGTVHCARVRQRLRQRYDAPRPDQSLTNDKRPAQSALLQGLIAHQVNGLGNRFDHLTASVHNPAPPITVSNTLG
jgi:hypothetical protein